MQEEEERLMRGKRSSEVMISKILKEHESGVSVQDLVRQHEGVRSLYLQHSIPDQPVIQSRATRGKRLMPASTEVDSVQIPEYGTSCGRPRWQAWRVELQ